MADSSPATVTVTLRPTISLATLKTAITKMDATRRNKIKLELADLAKL